MPFFLMTIYVDRTIISFFPVVFKPPEGIICHALNSFVSFFSFFIISCGQHSAAEIHLMRALYKPFNASTFTVSDTALAF